MCGIGGILAFSSASPPRLATLRAMGHALAHRGPDGLGHYLSGPVGLTHRRLSIIDVTEGGKQPMSWRDGRYWITYNGEVYNYLELRTELEGRGVTFRSDSDTEVLLAAYEAWGLEAFSRMNGMWGLALWDDVERRLVLARDRVGVKPLHLHFTSERLLFASEAKALLAAEPALAELEPREVARFLERSALSFGRTTLFRGIESLEPGTALVVEPSGRRQSHRYWRFTPALRPKRTPLDVAAREVRELLVDAVRLRFRSDVPVGTCLSGGIDSSAIVCIADQELGQTPQTFSVIYQEQGFSEGEFVRIAEQRSRAPKHHVTPDGRDLAEVLIKATYHQEYPTVGPGVYSQWQVMKLAQPHVKVLLDGQGSDELYGGYHYNLLTAARGALHRLERGQLSALMEILKAYGEVRALTGEDVLRALASSVVKPPYRKHVRPWVERVRAQLPGATVRPPARPLLAPPELAALLDDERASWPVPRLTGDDLSDQLWDEVTRTSLPSLLHYEDRDSMAHSIEARTPFLDYRLVEHAFSLPPEHKIYGGRTKHVLREALVGVLPEAIRERKDKKGYPTPFGAWIRTHHADWLRDVVLSPRALGRGYVRPAEVRRLVDEHAAGRDHAWALFRLVTLELFCQRFLDVPFVAEPAPPGAAKDEDEAAPSV